MKDWFLFQNAVHCATDCQLSMHCKLSLFASGSHDAFSLSSQFQFHECEELAGLNCSIFRMIFETLLHQFGNANSWRFVRYVGVGGHSSQLTRSFNLHFKLSKNCTTNVDNRIVRRSLNQTCFSLLSAYKKQLRFSMEPSHIMYASTAEKVSVSKMID